MGISRGWEELLGEGLGPTGGLCWSPAFCPGARPGLLHLLFH